MPKTKLRRELRHNSTPAEKVFWAMICDRKVLDLKFRRQHSIGPYIVDFYCAALRLIIEIDGDTHGTVEGIKADKKRTAYLESLGYTVLRYANSDILNNLEGVFQDLTSKLQKLLPNSTSSPILSSLQEER
ncbi:MAG: endonuclease domain-containing protein [Candidatus Doudnabacteria bacterium]|nr:endonuclease domain-containing protein [Candidatus Doudnabacteria bacterium]